MNEDTMTGRSCAVIRDDVALAIRSLTEKWQRGLITGHELTDRVTPYLTIIDGLELINIGSMRIYNAPNPYTDLVGVPSNADPYVVQPGHEES